MRIRHHVTTLGYRGTTIIRGKPFPASKEEEDQGTQAIRNTYCPLRVRRL